MVGVSDEDRVTAGWVAAQVRRRVPAWARRRYQDWEDWEQDVWLYALRALANYKPGRVPFGAWAALCVERRLRRRVGRDARRHDRFWRPMPESPGGEPVSAELPARPERRPALAVWCEGGFAELRARSLTWRQRVALYLRLVEGEGQVVHRVRPRPDVAVAVLPHVARAVTNGAGVVAGEVHHARTHARPRRQLRPQLAAAPAPRAVAVEGVPPLVEQPHQFPPQHQLRAGRLLEEVAECLARGGVLSGGYGECGGLASGCGHWSPPSFSANASRNAASVFASATPSVTPQTSPSWLANSDTRGAPNPYTCATSR